MKTTEVPTHEPDSVPVVMVIEDDVAVGEVIGVLLEDAGYRVIPLQSAPTAQEVGGAHRNAMHPRRRMHRA